MKHTVLLSAALASLTALPASAQCYADYKAKQENPLKLHYGVIELPDTACANQTTAADYLVQSGRLDEWQLLNVISLFDETGLEQRKDSAGSFYLRF